MFFCSLSQRSFIRCSGNVFKTCRFVFRKYIDHGCTSHEYSIKWFMSTFRETNLHLRKSFFDLNYSQIVIHPTGRHKTASLLFKSSCNRMYSDVNNDEECNRSLEHSLTTTNNSFEMKKENSEAPPELENFPEPPFSVSHVWDYIKSHNTQLFSRRLTCAYSLPDHKRLHEFILISLALFIFAAPISYFSHLVHLDRANLCPTVYLKVFFIPCLAEETLFRVIMNPHRSEKQGLKIAALFGFVSVILYVLWHPFNAWLFTVSMRSVFYDPGFLFITSLLGMGCQVLYFRFGSVFPSVFLHWLVVCVWVSLGGKADICT